VTRYAGAGNMYFAEIVSRKGTYKAYIYRIVNGVQKQLAVQSMGSDPVSGLQTAYRI
jgi:hypothetical protein